MLEGARGAHVCRSSTRRERVLEEEEEGEAVEEATKGKREREGEREREMRCKIVWGLDGGRGGYIRMGGERKREEREREGWGDERKGRREERWGERESRRGNKRQVRDGATGEPLVGAKSPLDGPPSVPTESHGAETRPGPYYRRVCLSLPPLHPRFFSS